MKIQRTHHHLHALKQELKGKYCLILPQVPRSGRTNNIYTDNIDKVIIDPEIFYFRLERKKRDKEEQVAYKLEQEIALWDPTAAPDDAVTTDPFKTLFVGRINNYTSENKIRREFESYGPIKTIKMVHDKESNKPKGYCFIEFEHERDMHCKYLMSFYSRDILLNLPERSIWVKLGHNVSFDW